MKQKEYVSELSTMFWNSTEICHERIKKLRELEPDSFIIPSTMTTAQKDNITGYDQHDDTKSEYSVASHLSRVSYQSNISFMSHASQNSQYSTSGLSSASTTVSVLSDLKFNKTTGCSSFNTDNNNSDNFSIAGLDHNLLSRGQHSEWEKQNSDKIALSRGGQIKKLDKHKISEKRQKKHDRKRYQRVLGQDLLNLGREKELCMELWNIVQFSYLMKEIVHLCDALLLIHSKQTYSINQLNSHVLTTLNVPNNMTSSNIEIADIHLAILLQNATDDFAIGLKTHIPPIAPFYPYHFLIKKQLLVICRFQDVATMKKRKESTVDVDRDEEDDVGDFSKYYDNMKSWWQTAADGILEWEKTRKNNLLLHF